MSITSERIKIRRRELGLSQTELSKKMGYKDRSIISRIESGEIDLNQSRVVKFAAALDTSIEYLMGLDMLDNKREIEMLLNRLTDKELETVVQLLRQMTAGRT